MSMTMFHMYIIRISQVRSRGKKRRNRDTERVRGTGFFAPISPSLNIYQTLADSPTLFTRRPDGRCGPGRFG